MSELEKLLDAAQVAEITGRDPRSILNAVRDGKLIAVRLGHRTVRFRPQDVEAYIETHRQVVAP